MANETGRIFKTEQETAEKIALSYYYPSKKCNGKRIKAGGIYYDKYGNVRDLFIENDLISSNEITIEGM